MIKPAPNVLHMVSSISELHRLFWLPKPDHPLISVIDFNLISFEHSDVWQHFAYDFYCIVIKKGVNGKFRYGQRDYDFDEGLMSFTKPGQVFSVTHASDNPVTGYMLLFKADLIRQYPLGKIIGNYGFFSYSIAEALHLSDKEDAIISLLMQQMQQELKNNIDSYSQGVIVSHLDLLLNYADRFYNRQFITRKSVSHDLLARLDEVLANYFNKADTTVTGQPTVQSVASALNTSANYLSDMLRSLTGQGAKQYIHEQLIEKAKELLSTTRLSVGEIAYQLGFEYPQSFSKLFKKKMGKTPLEYRISFQKTLPERSIIGAPLK